MNTKAENKIYTNGFLISRFILLFILSFVFTGCGDGSFTQGTVRKEVEDRTDPKPEKEADSIAEKIDVKPELFLLKKSEIIVAGESEDVSIDYQLVTVDKGIRDINSGKISFDLNIQSDVNQAPELSYKIYSLDTYTVLFEGDFTHLSTDDSGLSRYEIPGFSFETDTNMMILSVVVKGLSGDIIQADQQQHLLKTKFEIENSGLAAVEKDVVMLPFNENQAN